MSDAFHWRGRFVTLVNDLYRHIGLQEPTFPSADDQALVLAMRHLGADISLVHEGTAPLDRFQIECPLDAAPAGGDDGVTRELLALNLDLIREGIGTLGICPERQAILLRRTIGLASANVEQLVEELDTVAECRAAWRDRLLPDAAMPPESVHELA